MASEDPISTNPISDSGQAITVTGIAAGTFGSVPSPTAGQIYPPPAPR